MKEYNLEGLAGYLTGYIMRLTKGSLSPKVIDAEIRKAFLMHLPVKPEKKEVNSETTDVYSHFPVHHPETKSQVIN